MTCNSVFLLCCLERKSHPHVANVLRWGLERFDLLFIFPINAEVVRFIGVMCAAVADYTPEVVCDTKIKKSDDDMCIRLRRTRDIAAELGSRKEHRVLVGFALETDNEQANAVSKLTRKNLDFVVLNSLKDPLSMCGRPTT